MEPFNKWLELRESDGFNQRLGVGGDPLMSALNKINKGQGHQPFDGGYAGIDILAKRLGFDDGELKALYAAKLLAKDEMGYHIDKNRFNSFYTTLMKMTPDQYRPQALPHQ